MVEKIPMTAEGHTVLEKDLKHRQQVERPRIIQQITDARTHGDLSENAEYEDAKNEQAFVEGKIQTLGALIKNATIIDENHSTEHVQIGSTVSVESTDGAETFTIVGSAEANPSELKLSNESPVGRAILGHKKGETVEVAAPRGSLKYKIMDIKAA